MNAVKTEPPALDLTEAAGHATARPLQDAPRTARGIGSRDLVPEVGAGRPCAAKRPLPPRPARQREPFQRTRAASRWPAAAHEDDGAAQERLRDASPFFRGEMQGRNAPFRARIDRRLGRGRFSLLLLQTSSRTRCRNVSKKENEQKKKR